MLADFEDVLDKLKVASRNSETAMCFCPAHYDRNNPSLSIKAENGRLLHCFAGCQPEDIVSEMGLEMKDLFVEGEGGLLSPPARLHACTPKARKCMNKRETGVQRVMHTLNTIAHSMRTPK
jgi:hypothetical protein